MVNFMLFFKCFENLKNLILNILKENITVLRYPTALATLKPIKLLRKHKASMHMINFDLNLGFKFSYSFTGDLKKWPKLTCEGIDQLIR